MKNLDILKLKTDLVDVLNKSDLPAIVKQMTLSEVMNIMNGVTMRETELEKQALAKVGEKDGEKIHKAKLAE